MKLTPPVIYLSGDRLFLRKFECNKNDDFYKEEHSITQIPASMEAETSKALWVMIKRPGVTM